MKPSAHRVAQLWLRARQGRHYKVDTSRVRRRTERDPEVEKQTVDDYGFYQFWTYEIRPIRDIEDVKPWSQAKLDAVVRDIEGGKALKPIEVYDPERGSKLLINDGIHRLNASKLLGFTHIPVLRRTTVTVRP